MGASVYVCMSHDCLLQYEIQRNIVSQRYTALSAHTLPPSPSIPPFLSFPVFVCMYLSSCMSLCLSPLYDSVCVSLFVSLSVSPSPWRLFSLDLIRGRC